MIQHRNSIHNKIAAIPKEKTALRHWKNIILAELPAGLGRIIHKRALEGGILGPSDIGYTEYDNFYLDKHVLEVLREYMPD